MRAEIDMHMLCYCPAGNLFGNFKTMKATVLACLLLAAAVLLQSAAAAAVEVETVTSWVTEDGVVSGECCVVI